jgi:ABC-type thiamin/hydroxymethylpyrimidine transport system permease subunit
MVGIGTIISGLAVGFCVQIVFAAFRFDATVVEHETLSQTFRGKRKS